MKEIVVLSGKGGTGKTSITAALASLAGQVVLADCDVDAANLNLLLQPALVERHEFSGAPKAVVDPARCTACGLCQEACRFDAIRTGAAAEVDALRCEGCGVCLMCCPEAAITMEPTLCGHWSISSTALGPLVHARLLPGSENSGRLVSILRQAAQQLARRSGAAWLLCDGPPGTGCPAISTLTGAGYALLVTESTLSGFEDLKRVAALVAHFKIPAGVLINKADVNSLIAARIEEFSLAAGCDCLGRIPIDPAFNRAQIAGVAVLAAAGEELRRNLENVWRSVATCAQSERRPFNLISNSHSKGSHELCE